MTPFLQLTFRNQNCFDPCKICGLLGSVIKKDDNAMWLTKSCLPITLSPTDNPRTWAEGCMCVFI